MGRYLQTTICFLFIMGGGITTTAQESKKIGLDLISHLINSDSTAAAEIELTNQIHQLKSVDNYDSLIQYIFPLGKLELLQKNEITRSLTLVDEIAKKKNNPASLGRLNLELAKLHFERSELSKAFEYGSRAKDYGKKTNDESLLINCEYYLGDYAMRMGNIGELETNMRSAYKRVLNNKGEPYSITARVMNLMGAVMFYSSKQDSAQYFFESALKFVPNLEDNLENKLYLPAAIQGNLFIIKLNSGEHTEATRFAEESLRLNQKFLRQAPNHPLANRVKRNLALGYVNLSSLHFDLGDFERSEDIMRLGYDFSQQNFEPKTEEYFLTVLGVAEVKNAQEEPEEAVPFLEKAEACLENMETENYQLRAYLYNVFGSAFYKMGTPEKALEYYKKSDLYYQKFNGDSYDSNRLYQSMNLGIISAELGYGEEAIRTVKNAYDYIVKENGDQNYFANILALTLAKVNFELKDYQETLRWSNVSLDIYDRHSSEKGYDKLYFEEKKAEVILLNVKAKYHLKDDRDTAFLKKLISEIGEGIKILEVRKSVISSNESVNVLLENNKEIFDFSKKLNLELYQKTQDIQFLNQVVSLHESALYNRIRVRLNINKAISFSGISEEILDRENHLRDELNINPEEESTEALENLLKAKSNWNSFLDSLKQEHPKYYKMRYATIGESLNRIQDKVAEHTTVVKYFFVDEKLYAYLLTNDFQKLFALNYSEVDTKILALGENQSDLSKTSKLLDELYSRLWKPFQEHVKTERVIIIPDGVLYNLSFESLTPNKINSFKEIANNSLLARHHISYNYSLYLLNKDQKPKVYENNFVAFAPEFNNKMKQKYQLAITDSISLDKTYLTLLQQPFNVNLAKTYSTLFDGSFFLNENSTEAVFKQNANEHKIIHIGTHAESNNLSPELSRLFFAKNIVDTTDEDGSLYTYEIYNTSLNSNLAILTACETGKPTYQAGEGMISLAHAFNYAGSESILTSLWKIDERSSSEIIELFYGHIKSGKPKDEALRAAKLEYLSRTEGRTVAPQYWAGLVLMGDTAPIDLASSLNWIWWILAALILVSMVFIVLKKKN